jgi:oxygen-dependent protoporphyrinogen oxidase
MNRVVIIGGGITGLAAAHRVLEQSRELGKPVDLTILEAGPCVGGIVQTHERDGFLLENGPDSFISEKPAALAVVKRLGLESHLIETNEDHRRSFVVKQGRLLPVPEGFHLLAPARLWPFLRSDIFSWRGKARMALDLILPRSNFTGVTGGDSNNNTHADADESLAQFVRRRLGKEALERMAQPMVGGIYTADPEQLSLQATMPRFLKMEREHRSLIRALRKENRSRTVRKGAVSAQASGARYSLFLSFDRGMQMLTDKLEEQISNFKFQIPEGAGCGQIPEGAGCGQISEGNGSGQISICVNTTVRSLALARASEAGDSKKWKIETDQNEPLTADAVVLALPAYVSARLLRPIDAQLASELDRISYASSATINLAYKREDIPHPLDGFGFVVPFIEKRSLIACTFSSVKFAGRAPAGHVLLRAFVGGALQPEMFDLSRDELLSRVRADLRDLLGIERAPLFAQVTKWERSMPQYHVGHLELVKRIAARVASLPSLALAGNAYTGLGIPDCIRSGETAAEAIFSTVNVNLIT